MTYKEIIEKIKRISDIVLQAQESVTWAQSESYVIDVATELEKLELRLQIEEGFTPEQITGKRIFLESYNTDLESELDSIWKHLTMLRISLDVAKSSLK